MASEEHFVIIGNGPAGSTAALTLKEKMPSARVSIISREEVPSYRRCDLPRYIEGRLTQDELFVHPLAFYKERGIKLRLGQQVAQVDFQRQQLLLEHRESVCYTGLIIAVGGRPRIPEPLLVFQGMMLCLKELHHAQVWRQHLEKAQEIMIIGGDLISLGISCALVNMGKQVCLMLDEEAFWPVRFNVTIAEQVRERLGSRGVKVTTARKIQSITRLADGRIQVQTPQQQFQVDLVGAFFGLVPDVGFLARSGLHIDRGILVDEYLQTPFEGVYAAGDCAQVYAPDIRDYWISIGHQNALNLGRTAALNLIGGKIPAAGAPAGIFDVEGVNINTSWWTEF